MVSSWVEDGSSFNSVHTSAKVADNNEQYTATPPRRAVRLEVLKRLETEFQRRKIVNLEHSDLLHPLWFLAETERNVFLWRRKLSIGAAENFDFWVDVQALISKRLAQLEQPHINNPFCTGALGEREYLLSVRDLVLKIEQHLAVLCMLGDYIKTISSSEAPKQRKEIILLPAGFVVN